MPPISLDELSNRVKSNLTLNAQNVPVPKQRGRPKGSKNKPRSTLPTNTQDDKKSEIELPPDACDANGVFRYQNQSIHLTYKGSYDGKEFIDFISSKAKMVPTLYSFVSETGETGYVHSHVLLKFPKALCSRDVHLLDYNSIHPNVKKVVGKTHWDNCVRYHHKQGTPYTNIPLDGSEPKREVFSPQDVWTADTPSEALVQFVESVSGVRGVLACFEHKPIDYGPEPNVEWRPWQRALMDELDTEPDTRTIKWYWDPAGNSGKTFLAKHCAMYKGALVSTRANIYHLATTLQGFMQANKNTLMTVIFNFSRQTEVHKIYSAIESLKDGLVTSEKYNGKTLVFPSPHVVVMANYLPDLSQCSLDRWSLRYIRDGYDLGWVYSGNDIKAHLNKVVPPGVSTKDALNEIVNQLYASV